MVLDDVVSKWYDSQHFLKIAVNLSPQIDIMEDDDGLVKPRWPPQSTSQATTSIVNSKSTEVEEGEEL